MFPNWLGLLVQSVSGLCLMFDLRMHSTKNVGNYQSTGTGVGIKLDILASRSGANTVESNRALDCGVDALDSNADDAPLVLRQVYQ